MTPGSDDSISVCVHSAQTASIQGELDMLALTRAEMHARHPAQRVQRRAGRLWKGQIELNNFIAFAFT